jgi:hypothetical protein
MESLQAGGAGRDGEGPRDGRAAGGDIGRRYSALRGRQRAVVRGGLRVRLARSAVHRVSMVMVLLVSSRGSSVNTTAAELDSGW